MVRNGVGYWHSFRVATGNLVGITWLRWLDYEGYPPWNKKNRPWKWMVKKDDPFGKVCPRVGANLVSFGEGRIFSEYCWCFFLKNPTNFARVENLWRPTTLAGDSLTFNSAGWAVRKAIGKTTTTSFREASCKLSEVFPVFFWDGFGWWLNGGIVFVFGVFDGKNFSFLEVRHLWIFAVGALF